jgi:hypothetical protein
LTILCNIETALECYLIANCRVYPPLTTPRKNGPYVAIEDSARILEISFGVSFDNSDVLTRLIEKVSKELSRLMLK